MNFIKRIISALLCFTLLLCVPVAASATTTEGYNNTEEYIRFTPSSARIDEDGNFDFYIRSSKLSGKFYATSNKMNISASAYIYNNKDGGVRKSDSVSFKITLYKDNADGTNTSVGSFTTKADKKTGSKEFTVTKNQKYYLEITIEGGSNLKNTEYVKGSGRVSNMSL